MRISRPLEGDPRDLGKIRKPTIDDFKMYYKGDKSMPNTLRAPFLILSGDDGRRYIAIAEIEPLRGWISYFKLVLLPGDAKDGHFPVSPSLTIEYDNKDIGYKESKDKVTLWLPKGQDPEALSGDNYFKFDTSPTKHYFKAYRKRGFSIFSIELEMEYLGTPFWYNKGNPAYIREEGPPAPFVGFEGMVSVEGEMFLQGRKVRLKGYGDVDSIFFYNAKLVWGPHDWMYFVSDQVYGVLFHDHDFNYRDGGVNIYGEDKYLVPVEFKIEPIEYEFDYCRYKIDDKTNKIPIKTKIEVETVEGKLEMVGQAIGRFEFLELDSKFSIAEIAYLITGSFKYNNGNVIELTNGVSWHEVCAVGEWVHEVGDYTKWLEK